MTPTNIPMMITPVRVHTTASNLAGFDKGVRSPYLQRGEPLHLHFTVICCNLFSLIYTHCSTLKGIIVMKAASYQLSNALVHSMIPGARWLKINNVKKYAKNRNIPTLIETNMKEITFRGYFA